MCSCKFTETQSYNFNKTKMQNNRSNDAEKWRQCNILENNFRIKWYYGYKYLSKFLYNLQSLNCPQFKDQCLKQTFAYNQFTSLMYLKFCNESEFMIKCFNEVESALEKQENVTATVSWSELVAKINYLTLNQDEMRKPCLQVAMYDSKEVSRDYVEIVNINIPFCSVVWCGFTKKIFNTSKISLWTCMPEM